MNIRYRSKLHIERDFFFRCVCRRRLNLSPVTLAAQTQDMGQMDMPGGNMNDSAMMNVQPQTFIRN